MATTAIQLGSRESEKTQVERISLKDFLLNYSDMEDGYKYEWNDGAIEKSATMNQAQTAIWSILLPLFFKTQTFKNGGILISETDMKTSETQLRRPDIAIYTGEQIPFMKKGQNQVAPWVAEVISENDNINKVESKKDEYFEAGVKVVWHIFPESKKVYVYTAPDKVKICTGSTICESEPALGDFKISADALFA